MKLVDRVGSRCRSSTCPIVIPFQTQLLTPSTRTSVCPYKGTASYWSLKASGRSAQDAVWSYLDPLPECPRIKGHFAFYPEKLDRLDVEGGTGGT